MRVRVPPPAPRALALVALVGALLPAAAPAQSGPAGAVEEVTREAEDALKDAGEAIGGGIRKLFGD